MIAVIFEVQPRETGRGTYFEIAGELKESLVQMDGFISIERFQSLTDPRRLLSLSFWRDEASVAAWRAHLPHREAQERGRKVLFENYRLRVAEVLRDYGMNEREQSPKDATAD